ncbi:hypothetical protein ACKAVU_16350 [Acinetobacter baumannii]
MSNRTRELPDWAQAIQKRFIDEAMRRFYNAPINKETFEGITEMMLRFQFEIITYPLPLSDDIAAWNRRPKTTDLSKETVRVVGVIADKIEDGTLFDAGIYSRADLAKMLRRVLSALPR